MPTENRSTTSSIPPVIGETPLGGSYYAVECTRCGWVGSSEELTDDCQCTQPDGEHVCLGHTDEIGPERLLGIVQAMAKQAGQNQGYAVAWLVGSAIWWDRAQAEQDAQLIGESVVALGPMAPPGEAGELRAEVKRLDLMVAEGDYASDSLSARLAEQGALLRKLGDEFRKASDWICREVAVGTKSATYWAARLGRNATEATAQLTDSAEPNAPVGYPDRLCHIDYTAHPYRCGCLKSDEESQRIYDEHRRNASAEPAAPDDPHGCNACTHPCCAKYQGPTKVECRVMAENACARPGAEH